MPASGDKRNSVAHRLGLAERFAWVLDTCRPDLGPDSFFDGELLLGLSRRYLHEFSYDKVSIEMPCKGKENESVATLWRDALLNLTPQPLEPFLSATISHQGNAVCYMEIEPWARVGGPDPYHDSYTLSVYGINVNRQKIIDGSKDIAKKYEAELEAILTGVEAPP